MEKKKIYTIFLVSIIAICIIASVIMLAGFIKQKSNGSSGVKTGTTVANGDKLFDANKESGKKQIINITTEVIEDGLRNKGTLVTQEYYFTQAETYEKKEGTGIFISTSKMIYSYDGAVYAGIDCSEIKIEKDDSKKVITVTLPKSKVTSVDIDFDSFKEFEYKQGWWSKIKLSDVNTSLQEFKDKAEKSALEKGVLDKADDNAELIIEGIIRSIVNDGEYDIRFYHK